MTTLGLEALKLNETKRANLANEGIKHDTLAETRRANLANEGIKLETLAEQVRTNQANERLKKLGIDVDWAKLDETIRHNDAVEKEAFRSNSLDHATKDISQAVTNQDLGYGKGAATVVQTGRNILDTITSLFNVGITTKIPAK